MSANNEYSILRKQDDYSDESHFVLRETTLASGLVIAEELARLDYSDQPLVQFPDGLIEPTRDETVKYAGAANFQPQPTRTPEWHAYGSAMDITQVKQRITEFVVEGVMKGRSPIFAWNDTATDAEVEVFHEAARDVERSQNQDSDDDQQTGLYL